MGFFSSDAVTRTDSTSTTTPNIPSFYLDAIQGNLGDIEADINRNKALTADEAIVDFSQDELDAFERARNVTGKYDPALDNSLSTLQQVQQRAFEGVSPEDIARYSNPYQQNVTDIAKREITRDADIARESINANAANAGAFGGSRHGVVEAELNRNLAEDLSDVQYRGLADSYGVALDESRYSDTASINAANQIGNLSNTAQGITTGDTSQLAQVGQSLRDFEQNKTDFSFNNAINQGNQFQNTLNSVNTGIYGSTTTGSQTNTAEDAGAGVGSQLLGAGLTAASIFSDERVKENKKRVGATDDGTPIYTYNYKGDDKTQMGVMAQELEKKHPEAVSETQEGVKMVDYNAVQGGQEYFDGGSVLSALKGLGGDASFSDKLKNLAPTGLSLLNGDGFEVPTALQFIAGNQEPTKGTEAAPVEMRGEVAPEQKEKSALAGVLSGLKNNIRDNKAGIDAGMSLMFEQGGPVDLSALVPSELSDEEFDVYRKKNPLTAEMLDKVRPSNGKYAASNLMDALKQVTPAPTNMETLKAIRESHPEAYARGVVELSNQPNDISPLEAVSQQIQDTEPQAGPSSEQGFQSVLEQISSAPNSRSVNIPSALKSIRMPELIPTPSAAQGESLGKQEPTFRDKVKSKAEDLASDPLFNFGLALLSSDKPFSQAVGDAGQAAIGQVRTDAAGQASAAAASREAAAAAAQQQRENALEDRKVDITQERADAYTESVNYLANRGPKTNDKNVRAAFAAEAKAINEDLGLTSDQKQIGLRELIGRYGDTFTPEGATSDEQEVLQQIDFDDL